MVILKDERVVDIGAVVHTFDGLCRGNGVNGCCNCGDGCELFALFGYAKRLTGALFSTVGKLFGAPVQIIHFRYIQQSLEFFVLFLNDGDDNITP